MIKIDDLFSDELEVKNNVSGKLLEELKKTKKRNNELTDELDKLKIESQRVLSIEREKCKKLQEELNNLTQISKKLKNDLMNAEAKLSRKDKDIDELKGRVELKENGEARMKERERQVFLKFFGRLPDQKNPNDTKTLQLMSKYAEELERTKKECFELRIDNQQKTDILKEVQLQKTKIEAALQDQDLDETKQVIQELCNLYQVTNARQLLDCCQKTERILLYLPKLQSFVWSVCSLVSKNFDNPNYTLEEVIASLQVVIQASDERNTYKKILCDVFKAFDLEFSFETHSLIFNKVEELFSLLHEYKQKDYNSGQQGLADSKLRELFKRYFNLGENEKIDIKLQQIHAQLTEIHIFLKKAKCALAMEGHRNEDVLEAITSLLEEAKTR
eukprot:TRINITY_DN2144_c0_g1_i1.p1 TRINITY_DN2144_c0_g1~~TRINITY_DN2144_c0_g1_i1.p1  ORF type:complete len:388 (-),score=106.88 TRINITY_DN2144_c0_g1_i1:48-1211(-)